VTAATMWVLGYGSLMSAHGLGPQAPLLRDLWPACVVGRRVFDKPAPQRGFIAMDVERPPRATLVARRILTEACRPTSDAGAFVGALLLLEAEGTALLARREGYPMVAWERLRQAAGERELGELLLDLARQTGDDPAAYRAALRELGGPSDLPAYDYLPHPVDTGSGPPAVAFLAPGHGHTSDPVCDSTKAHCASWPMALDRLYRDGPRAMATFDARVQEGYVRKCALGAAHGMDLTDMLGTGLAPDDPTARMFERWRREANTERCELTREREHMGALVPALADPAAHAKRFPGRW
jgi:hypothetical protein